MISNFIKIGNYYSLANPDRNNLYLKKYWVADRLDTNIRVEFLIVLSFIISLIFWSGCGGTNWIIEGEVEDTSPIKEKPCLQVQFGQVTGGTEIESLKESIQHNLKSTIFPKAVMSLGEDPDFVVRVRVDRFLFWHDEVKLDPLFSLLALLGLFPIGSSNATVEVTWDIQSREGIPLGEYSASRNDKGNFWIYWGERGNARAVMLLGKVLDEVKKKYIEDKEKLIASMSRMRPQFEKPNPPVLAFRFNFLEPSGNGCLDAEETGKIRMSISNSGNGVAHNVKMMLSPLEPKEAVIFQDIIYLKDIPPKGNRTAEFTLRATENIKNDSIRFKIQVSDENGFEAPSAEICIPTREYFSDVDTNIPKGLKRSAKGVAVVIGISQYKDSDIPTVDYARQDAETMKKYLINTLGFDSLKIIELYDEKARLSSFKLLFEERLAGLVQPGQSDLFIFYSGHGVPDPETKDAFFVPYDCSPSYAKSTGYSVNQVYYALSKLKAKRTVVVIDACFSGGSEKGMLLKEISPIYITAKNPLAMLENGFVFASCTGDQVSTWYHEKKHGLFTYFFLKGLRGEADLDDDGSISVEEMERYLSTNITQQALYLNNRKQTPVVIGKDKKTELIRLK